MPALRSAAPLTSLLLTLGLVVGCASSRPRSAAAVPAGWPVQPEHATISSSFGAPRGRSSHQGLDLSAARGTPVYATADGTVTFAGRSGSYGRLVVIEHGGGWETRYAHLHRIRIEKGDRVRRGDRVGTVGRSGNASGDHLHYEVRRSGVPVDPRPTLGGR
jgi:murein DD-endopeptidase MepM/ murein hydrolase activator NlpD